MDKRTHRSVSATPRRTRSGAFAAMIFVLAGGLAAVAPPAAAAQSRRADVPLLPSDPAPTARPEVPAGDFSYIPGSSGLSTARPKQAPASFDPARSIALEDQTTATRRVWRNADGT